MACGATLPRSPLAIAVSEAGNRDRPSYGHNSILTTCLLVSANNATNVHRENAPAGQASVVSVASGKGSRVIPSTEHTILYSVHHPWISGCQSDLPLKGCASPSPRRPPRRPQARGGGVRHSSIILRISKPACRLNFKRLEAGFP